MAATGRSLQALCRAAFSLASAASTSAAAPAALTQLGLRGGVAAAAAASSWGGLQQHAAAAAGLRQLARHFHASVGVRLADQGAAPSINPLQQAPAPATPAGSAADYELAPREELSGSVSRAHARGLPISPQKLNDFAKVVRGLHIEDALIQCSISPKKSAGLVRKVLLSARANAVSNLGLDDSRLRVGEQYFATVTLLVCQWGGLPLVSNLGLDDSRLRVVEAWVGKGQHLKRISMHGRGRSGRRLKYRSHLTVVLREEENEPRRRTRIVPQLMERDKYWRVRAAQAAR
ncbi:50S ribosomal L22-like isoform X2 isoform A [Chlorella sorokiniana]|uniref:50S ribosomal L22-like isoform X2 isoform A n=1 Tax=Chlorella sorokiniana TaxID=3076 RepID=A0A2P6TJF8_CHLSO|nr:50S ribosomal L22-like isoform X2 isoform A [Chlorella sorokiniana]|eukprot:PRW39363.1 50S ribosomal L22-like isoform X2 isoform A [Chlorella sorokiniana]